jgi:CRISPR/Cas system CSM-associated protein Csm2 small subunit
MATNEAQMTETSRKALARHLRKSFEGKVLPHVLDKISDDDLVRQYFENAGSKARAIAEKSKFLRDRLKKDSGVEVL